MTAETTPITIDQIFDGFALNLTKAGGDGSCTGTKIRECSIRSNATSGTIIPPVRSARLNTRGKKSITYGRVEVVAKLPVGDWIWPAICELRGHFFCRITACLYSSGMMPEESVYGPWPASGEIDIMESRGNEVGYELGGRDVISSTVHWGRRH